MTSTILVKGGAVYIGSHVAHELISMGHNVIILDNLTSAHIKTLLFIQSENKNLIINLGTGNGYSVFELLTTTEKVSGKKINYKITSRRPGDPEVLIANPALANNILGWKAQYSDAEQIFKSMIPIYLN